MERNRKWETRSAKTKKENQLYYEEHVARRNSIRLWFATSPTTPQGIYDTKSLSGGFSRMEHGRGRLGGAWLSFQGSSSRKASFLCREQPRVESRNSVPHHSAFDVLTHAYTCTYTDVHGVETVQRSVDTQRECVSDRPKRRLQSVEGAGSRMPVFPGPRIWTAYFLRSFSILQIRDFLFLASRLVWLSLVWYWNLLVWNELSDRSASFTFKVLWRDFVDYTHI